MKTILYLLSVVVFLSNSLYAQNYDTDLREEFMFGLKAGINYSNVYDSNGEEFKADGKIGIAAGCFLSILIGPFLGVQPEILFSQKGFKATGKILGSAYKITRTSNFIDIPLLIQIKPIENITILAGPQYSYLIKQTDVFENAIGTIEQVEEFENDNIRKNIFCITGGFDFNINHLVIGTRIGWDISKNNGDGTSSTPRYKNAWYQFTLGFRF